MAVQVRINATPQNTYTIDDTPTSRSVETGPMSCQSRFQTVIEFAGERN